MKKSDLFSMALQNLKNRKTRTKLTVIGVVIGTCAIVIMVSIGVGIDKMVTSQYQSDSTLNKISVYQIIDESNDEQTLPLNDRAVEYLSSIDNVKMVIPTLNIGEKAIISRGKYLTQWVTIKGVDFDAMKEMGYTLNEGSFDNVNKKNTVFFGDEAVTQFYDKQGNQVKFKYDENHKITDCEINPMEDVFFIEPCLYSEEEGKQQSTAANRIRIKVGGVLKHDFKIDYDTYDAVFVDMEFAKELAAQYNKLNSVHNEELNYGEMLVYVDNIDNVDAVQEKIQAAGFGCYSDKEDLDYVKKVMMVVQLVLGAIGAISMFVAAFGISNTMVMSVFERTKEIGIMKVLGCDLDDIKRLFLYEAGTIGLIGGSIGVGISIVISFIANAVARIVVSSMGEMEEGMVVCVSSVPPWLIILGIMFSMLVGILAGLSPAKRSVKVSALTAIHNE